MKLKEKRLLAIWILISIGVILIALRDFPNPPDLLLMFGVVFISIGTNITIKYIYVFK